MYRAAIGTTVRFASMRDEGQKFHDSRTPEGKHEISPSREEHLEYAPSRSSTSSKFIFLGKGDGERLCVKLDADAEDTSWL
jgi:hypothetical protein